MHDQHKPQAPLNGWKEIAAYLGKSVRSVQRWEATLGLPVHRIRTPDGQIVYSEQREIDDWRRRLAAPPAPEPEDPADPESLPEVSAPAGRQPGAPTSWRARFWLFAAGVALLLIGIVSGWWISRPAMIAYSVEFAGRSLHGLDQKGAVVWSFEFDRDVEARDVNRPGLRSRLVDLEGDGTAEWVVPVQSTVRGAVSDAIFCFSQGGVLKWSVQPDQKLTYNGRIVSAPWVLRDVEVAPAPPRRVWASLGSNGGGTSFVLEITAGGSSSMTYFQAGPITDLHHWQTPSGGFLVAGGYSAKHGRPSIVLLREHNLRASFPFDLVGMTSRPSCAECPTGDPARVFVFMGAEIATTAHAQTSVRQLRQVGADVMAVMRAGGIDTAHVTLKPNFSVATYEYTPAHWRAHKELEAQGQLAHTEENCPDRRTSNIFREWTPADGWHDREIRVLPHGS
jgi:hypothetical protein